jgi:membrane protein
MKKILITLWKALYNLFNDLSVDISGYIAYTSLLAIFPFLMLLVSLAGYLGTVEAVQTSIHQFYTILPTQVSSAIAPVIQEVTSTPPSGYLIVLVGIILWISSSSVEAIREGINHAYKVHEKRSYFYRRIQAILFVLLGSFTFLLASFILIFLPVGLEVWQLLEPYFEHLPDLPDKLGLKINLLQLMGAYGAIFLAMISMYRWLPYHKISLSHCLPGAMISSALWIMSAGLFSLYLQNFARYDVLYGSLGGIVITLVFFQITALLILYGAHINRVLWIEGTC